MTDKKKTDEERRARARKQIIEYSNDYHLITSKEEYEKIKKEGFKKLNTWVVDGNGVFLIRKNSVGEFTAKISDKGPKSLPKVMEQCYKMSTPKIPGEIWHQLRIFFRDIADDMNNAEAFAQIYWDKEEERYFAHVPAQQVSMGSVKYNGNDNLDTKEPNRYVLFGEVHSHNTMSAFFSGTDNADEKGTRFYGVFGKIKDPTPEFAIRFVVDSAKPTVDVNDVFDFADVDYPIEWKKSVKKVGEATGVKHIDKPEKTYGSYDFSGYNIHSYGGTGSRFNQKKSAWKTWDGNGLPDHMQEKLDVWIKDLGEESGEELQEVSEPINTETKEVPDVWDNDYQDFENPWVKGDLPDAEDYPGYDDEYPETGTNDPLQNAVDEIGEVESIEERWQIIGEFINNLYEYDVEMLCQQLEEYGYADEVKKRLVNKRAA